MKIDLLSASGMFPVAELSAMFLDAEICKFHNAYAAHGFAESPESRARYLLLTTGKRARNRSALALWVQRGGSMPSVLDLVDNR
jgi:predicted carbohydrate-binding protein with CBM5 and CBM33 domain